jgi:hypothetical protein
VKHSFFFFPSTEVLTLVGLPQKKKKKKKKTLVGLTQWASLELGLDAHYGSVRPGVI